LIILAVAAAAVLAAAVALFVLNRGVAAFMAKTVKLWKKRYSAVTMLIELASLYPGNGSAITGVSRARLVCLSANNMAELAAANAALTKEYEALIFAFPTTAGLSDENKETFYVICRRLASLEEKLAFTREFANRRATRYNKFIAIYPISLFAKWLSFRSVEPLP